MIYQELNLAPDLTVAENVMLGQEQSRFGLVRRGRSGIAWRQALALLGRADLPLDAPVRQAFGRRSAGRRNRPGAGDRSQADRVRRADQLADRQHDVESLFRVIEKLKRSGMAIIYISHFLEEIRRIADRYTVLRDGAVAGSGTLAGRQRSGHRLADGRPQGGRPVSLACRTRPARSCCRSTGIAGRRTPA